MQLENKLSDLEQVELYFVLIFPPIQSMLSKLTSLYYSVAFEARDFSLTAGYTACKMLGKASKAPVRSSHRLACFPLASSMSTFFPSPLLLVLLPLLLFSVLLFPIP